MALRKSTGYSHDLYQALTRLRKLGLPVDLFEADFEEKERENREAHADLLERLRTLEQSPEWQGIEFPWSAAREEFEQKVAEGEEMPFVATQPHEPVWKNAWVCNFMDWHNRWKAQKERDKRKLERELKKNRDK